MSSPENVKFDFENRVFGVEGAVFRKTSGGEVALYVSMGETVGAVPIKQLRSVFEIEAGSKDEKLLEYAIDGLEFVREIHPGDSVPLEVLTGEASWMVDEKYLIAAKARITMQLIAWLTKEEVESTDPRKFLERAEDPETKKLVQQAFSEIAEALGYGKEKREDVVQLVDRFAQEMSYIEALRDQLGQILDIAKTLKEIYKIHRSDSNMGEAITRCNTLLEKPVRTLFKKFPALDAEVGDVLGTLRDYDVKVELVRKVRDQFRQVYLTWEDLMAVWANCDTNSPTEAEYAIRETYRFAAKHFVQTDNWSLSA
ncbi:MAG: hypothetical protein OEO83_07980 [Alphaproteobacteria bacterium]|nr:hypothetical protein [Alphaproteobacteria bacterium]